MRATLPMLLVLGACGGQFGEEDGESCELVSETPLAMDEASSLGFSAQELVDLVGAEQQVPFTWADGAETTLTVTVSGATNARFQDWEPKENPRGTDSYAICDDVVAFDATVGFATDDGAFAESWSATMSSASSTALTLWRELDSVSGTFDPADWADDDYEEIWANLTVNFGAEGLAGEIAGVGQQSEGSGPDGTVSATMFPIATFGVAPE